MADFSGFASSSFDASEWVNRTLQSEEVAAASTNEIDAKLASLSMKLQLMSQDIGDNLEGAMAEASTVMWRTANDVTSIEKSVTSLQVAIQQLSDHIGANQSRHIAGVDELFRLDVIKRNMEQSKSILVEAAQWNQLVQEARTALAGQGKLKVAAERVEALQRCLQVLKSTPEHSTRESVLQDIKTTLMSKLQPQLQSGIAADDTAQLQELVYVFRILGEEAQASEQYIQRKPTAIIQQWEALQASQVRGRQFVQEFAHVCAATHSMIKDEAHNTVQLFGSAAAPTLLCAMLQSMFERQKVGLAQRLKQADMSCEDISACYHVTDRMLSDMLLLVQDARVGNLRAGYIACLEPYMLSKDTFVSKLIGRLQHVSGDMLAPLNRDHNSKPDSAMEDFLGDDDSSDSVQIAVANRFMDVCRTALTPYSTSVQCAVDFAGGIVCRQHNAQINQVLEETLQSLRQTILWLRASAGLHDEDTAAVSSPQTRAERSAQSTATKPAVVARSPSSSSIERSELVHVALRALQGVALLVKQIREAEFSIASQYARSYDDLFGAHVMTDEADQIVNRLSTNDFKKHVFNHLADAKQFGLADLRKFLYQFTAKSAPHEARSLAFSPVISAIQALRLTSNMLLLDICLEGPRHLLADMSKLPVWYASTSDTVEEHDAFYASSVADPLPQQLFTQLGEQLLSLVNLFEEFAGSEAAGEELDAVKSDPTDLQLAFWGWKALAGQLDPDNRTDIRTLVIDYQRTRHAIHAAEQAAFNSGDDRTQRSRATSEASIAVTETLETDFTDQWLRCIADAVVGVVIYQVLRIRKLSKAGRAQLVVDLRYLGNVLEALSPTLPPLLPHIIQLLDEDLAQARKRYESQEGAHFVRVLQNRILALREDFD